MTSCDIINPDEPIPAYIQIDSFALGSNSPDHGATTHNIVDAWVFVNGDMIGIFELPSRIPVLDEGRVELLVGPGIEVSGSSGLRDNYLFYSAFDSIVDLVPGEIMQITPEAFYREQNNLYIYDVLEDFESTVFSGLISSPNSDTGIIRTTNSNEVRSGKASGKIVINESMNYVQIQTATSFKFAEPVGSNNIFMELDFKSDIEMTLAVFADRQASLQNQTFDYITLRSTNGEWRKLYIAWTGTLAQISNPDVFTFLFRPVLPSNGGLSGTVYLDNIKLMLEQ